MVSNVNRRLYQEAKKCCKIDSEWLHLNFQLLFAPLGPAGILFTLRWWFLSGLSLGGCGTAGAAFWCGSIRCCFGRDDRLRLRDCDVRLCCQFHSPFSSPSAKLSFIDVSIELSHLKRNHESLDQPFVCFLDS